MDFTRALMEYVFLFEERFRQFMSRRKSKRIAPRATTDRISAERAGQLEQRMAELEQRMAELRDELAAAQCEAVSAATIQRDVALFDPVWDLLRVPERFRVLHLLLESVGYDGPQASSS